MRNPGVRDPVSLVSRVVLIVREVSFLIFVSSAFGMVEEVSQEDWHPWLGHRFG